MAHELRPARAIARDLPTISSGVRLLDGPARSLIERDLLVPYLLRQRWFGGKAREPRGACLVDWAALTPAPNGPLISIVEVTYVGGPADRYQLPLAIVSGARAEQILAERPETVLARVSTDSPGVLCDGMMDDTTCRIILAAARDGGEFQAGAGTVVAQPLAPGPPAVDEALEVARFASTYSNTAVALGGRYLLKLFRHVEPGLNPDIEIGRFLAVHGGAVRVPALIGSLEYIGREGTPVALALVQALVAHRGTGWDYALEELRQFFERVERRMQTGVLADAPSHRCPTPESPMPPVARELVGPFIDSSEMLGRGTAELHCALASVTADPAFAPEPASPDEVRLLARRLRQTSVEAFDLLARHSRAFAGDAGRLAARLLDLRPVLLDRIDRLGDVIGPFVKTRVHGDYHLGQVLYTDGDFVILDFEGEPARPLAERRAKQSPLRDVAGMLRSFSYAAHVGLAAAAHDDRRAALGPWAALWDGWTSEAFLRGYLARARGGSCRQTPSAQTEALLALFILDKAVYELQYELNNRPDWIHIPLAGLIALATG